MDKEADKEDARAVFKHYYTKALDASLEVPSSLSRRSVEEIHVVISLMVVQILTEEFVRDTHNPFDSSFMAIAGQVAAVIVEEKSWGEESIKMYRGETNAKH